MCRKLLIIEDDEFIVDDYKRGIHNYDRIIFAATIAEARTQFLANPDLAAIAVDACLGSKEPNTLELIREMKFRFRGPMIAISGLRENRALQLAAGCNEACKKDELPELLVQLDINSK
jgi:hypothetical protein